MSEAQAASADGQVSPSPLLAASAGDKKDNAASAAVIDNPSRYDGYSLTAIICEVEGRGVYRAEDERFGRAVVIHAFTPHAAQKDAASRFFSSAADVARLRHPALVRALDVARSGSQYLFIEEYIRGETLADKLARLERRRLGEREMLRLAYQLATALQALADIGLCHRWLRPDKILLGAEGRVRVRGAGHARHLRFSAWREALLENAAWVSPEHISDAEHLDIRADLYSLGCICFYALFGQPPFADVDAATILEAQASTPPLPPRERDPRLSAATSQLILWLLAKERAARPQSPRELMAQIKNHPLWEEDAPDADASPAGGSGDNSAHDS